MYECMFIKHTEITGVVMIMFNGQVVYLENNIHISSFYVC